MSALLFVNVRRTELERGAAFEAAHRLGQQVVLVADRVPGGLPSGVTAIEVDTATLSDERIDDLGREHRLAGVLAWSDGDVRTVSRIAAHLGLPGPTVTAAHRAKDKALMRAAVAAVAPDLVPRFARVTAREDLTAALTTVGLPGVLKPATASGSRGIFLIHDAVALETAYDHLADFGVLVYEELMPGTEHSVEGFVHAGALHIAGVTDKRTLDPFRIELTHVHPSVLPTEVLAGVHDATGRVVAALGLDDCTFHLECMVGAEGRVRLVEVGARGGGDFVASHLVTLATGRSFAENSIRVATGRPPLPAEGVPIGACVRKLVTGQSGNVAAYSGLDVAAQLRGVRHVVIERPVGGAVRQPPDDYKSCILGAVLTVGATPDEAEGNAQAATDAIRTQIVQDRPAYRLR
ncbi:MAG: ATP-grasp domain-containing protein [Dermatophilaceae bacterium]